MYNLEEPKELQAEDWTIVRRDPTYPTSALAGFLRAGSLSSWKYVALTPLRLGRAVSARLKIFTSCDHVCLSNHASPYCDCLPTMVLP